MNEALIAQLVDCFYIRVRQDPTLGPIFEGAIGDEWDSHLANMRAFWTSVMLGKAVYKGNPMAAHLGLPRLTSAHFDRWLELWRETAIEVCGPEGALFIQRAEAIASRLLSAVDAGHQPAALLRIS